MQTLCPLLSACVNSRFRVDWAAGEVPVIVVMLALLIQWQRSDRRTSTRFDRAAERDHDWDHDADMTAYNAMRAELAQHDRTGR